MAFYILRLDDACPNMDFEKWDRMEKMLDRYYIEPIVGVIPDNTDPDFTFDYHDSFWERCLTWQEKNWTIAIHGLNHYLKQHDAKGYFQKSHSVKTEWAGVPLEKQYEMLKKGHQILKSNGLLPSCFFAPCHTYDINTVEAIKLFNDNNETLFISDGYSLHPYKKNGVWFLPSLFDAPHSIRGNGYYTFVFHPNNMNDQSFLNLELFLMKNSNKFVNADKVMKSFFTGNEKSQGTKGKILEIAIYYIRGLRKLLR